MTEALTNQKNIRYMTRIRSAVTQGQRPSAALLCEPDPMGGWTFMDYLIQDAFFTLDRETCTICKNPVWLCHSLDNRIDFEIVTQTCYANAELEDFKKSDRFKRLDPGEYPLAKAVGVDNGDGDYDPLPTRKEAYESMPKT